MIKCPLCGLEAEEAGWWPCPLSDDCPIVKENKKAC